jgi:hypothetical protein
MALPKDATTASGAVTKYLDEYTPVDPESCELLGPTALVRGSPLVSLIAGMTRRVDWTGRPGLNGYYCHSLACL